MRSYYYRGSDSSLGNSQPEWGNLDILGACGASDSGSNPGSGVIINNVLEWFIFELLC